jgi:hypothetical protein
LQSREQFEFFERLSPGVGENEKVLTMPPLGSDQKNMKQEAQNSLI